MNFEINFVLPHWLYWSVLIFLPLVVMFFVDRSFRRGGSIDGGEIAEVPAGEEVEVGYQPPGNLFTLVIDRFSGFFGRYVAYWSLVAPFVFAYEVLMRYAFNSPTNWAHESMTLMFGMQYLMAGAFALREGGHVRVDILYQRARPLTRAALDLLTSVFFFIFTLALLVTGWKFFSQSVSDQLFFGSSYANEVSFTEWAVQYYPVKFMLFFGALLLLLQGIAQLIRDFQSFRHHRARDERGQGFPNLLVALGVVLAAWTLFEMVNIATTDYESLTGSLESVLANVGIGGLTLVMFGTLMVVLVLGIIFTGIATPVEAAGIGTFGALVVAAMHKRLTWPNLHAACMTTLVASAMVMWIIFGASIFVGFYILLLAVPIFVPLIKGLTFDGVFGLPGVDPADVSLWFGVIYLVNMQMSFLSPPFGYALFYIKGVCPPHITMAQIFRSSFPFLGIQALGLLLVILFPALVTWLPNLAYG